MKLLGNRVNSTVHVYLEQRQGKQTVFPSVKTQSTSHSCGEGFSTNSTHFMMHNDLLPNFPLTSWLSYLTSFFASDSSSVNWRLIDYAVS